MNTDQIEYFIELSNTENITKAAENLFISQQGLSSAMVRLEKELEIKLFRRTQNGITLTAEGLYFREQALKIAEIVCECRNNLQSKNDKKKKLKISSSYGVVEAIGGEMLCELEKYIQDASCDFIEYPGMECEKHVDEGMSEIGFAIGPINSKKFNSIYLFKRDLNFICHKSHPLAKHDSIDVSKLKNEKMICFNNNFKLRQIFNSMCSKSGFKPLIALEVGELALISKMVENNLGVGFTFSDSCNNISSEIKAVKSSDPSFVWAVHLIYKKEVDLSKSAKKFITFFENKYM
jgi:DNA-binding transcriptional LysR family regulator